MSEETCKKTKVTLLYDGKEHTFFYDWEDNYPIESAEFMFKEGNYSCDCNKAIFLNEYCGLNIAENCGQDIKLINLEHYTKDKE